jgi:hypothetical protein
VHGELVRLYSSVADHNYAAVASRFNQAADQFVKAARTCDPDVGSGDVIRLGEQARAAWLNSEVLSGELDVLLPVLCAAACLVGVGDAVAVLSAEGDVWRLPLCVDTGRAHRRKLWTAWNTTEGSRCGRWAALHRLGVKLRADAHPERLTAYAECPPFTAKWVPSPRGGHTQEYHDPCDDEQQGIIGRVKETLEAAWSAD